MSLLVHSCSDRIFHIKKKKKNAEGTKEKKGKPEAGEPEGREEMQCLQRPWPDLEGHGALGGLAARPLVEVTG